MGTKDQEDVELYFMIDNDGNWEKFPVTISDAYVSDDLEMSPRMCGDEFVSFGITKEEKL